MRAIELFESPLSPKQEYLDNLDKVLDQTRILYRSVQDQTAIDNPGYDNNEFDGDIWLAALRFTTKKLEAPFRWNLAGEDQGTNTVNQYLLSAEAFDDGTIMFNLYAPDMEDGLDFQIFKMVLQRTIRHEAVHMAQRDRMGPDMYANRYTGFQKSMKHFETNPQKGMKIYLSDPQEIMAHAHDLYDEAMAIGSPMEVFRNIQNHLEYLPTLTKYLESAGFSLNDKVVKRLLKIAIGYIKQE